MDTALGATLDYADLPIGSRLTVERTEHGFWITDPRTGFWKQLRNFLFGWAMSSLLFLSLMLGYLRWQFPQFAAVFGATFMLRAFVRTLDWELLAMVMVFTASAMLVGRISKTIIVDLHGIRFTHSLILFAREWTWEDRVERDEIVSVTVARWQGRVVIKRTAKRSLAVAFWAGRKDALWVARALRHELRLAD